MLQAGGGRGEGNGIDFSGTSRATRRHSSSCSKIQAARRSKTQNSFAPNKSTRPDVRSPRFPSLHRCCTVICQPRTAAHQSKLEESRETALHHTAVAPPISSKERGLLDPKQRQKKPDTTTAITAGKLPSSLSPKIVPATPRPPPGLPQRCKNRTQPCIPVSWHHTGPPNHPPPPARLATTRPRLKRPTRHTTADRGNETGRATIS